jgi:hypothetical protein
MLLSGFLYGAQATNAWHVICSLIRGGFVHEFRPLSIKKTFAARARVATTYSTMSDRCSCP